MTNSGSISAVRWESRIATILIFLACPVLAADKPADTPVPSVEIIRDTSGVPHVYGDTERALFFGVGYSLAQDRLAQWELARRAARGQMAEILGPKFVDSDKDARLRDHTDNEWRQILATLPVEYRQILTATRNGLNQYIRDAQASPRAKLPIEFKRWGLPVREWSMEDYAATLAQSLVYYGTGGGGHELENQAFLDFLHSKFNDADAKAIFDDVLPLTDQDAVPIVRASTTSPARLAQLELRNDGGSVAAVARIFERHLAALARNRSVLGIGQGASRSLLIGPQRSANGHVLMLQSTADGPDVHLSGAGFESAGFVLPAAPVPVMGRGSTFGWLVTTGEEDLVDTFVERLNPKDPEQYWFKGNWRRLESRSETIRVKGSRDVSLTVSRTAHGPVIVTDKAMARAYSQQSVTWNHELDDLAAFIELSRATSLAGFEQAVSGLRGSFNIQYGGEDGQIAHWHAGLIPVRATGVDPRVPTPGDGSLEWTGLRPFADWPKVINPPEGYLHVWNNKATATTTYGDASRYGKTFRTYLGRQIVEGSGKLTLDDLKEINRKLGSSAAGVDLSFTSPKFFTDYLMQSVEGEARLVEAVSRMAAWNGLYEDRNGDGLYDDPGLTIFRAWYEIAQEQLVGNVIGGWWHRIDDTKYIKYRTELLYRLIAGHDAGTALAYDWFRDRDRKVVLKETVRLAVEHLEKRFGSPHMSSWKQPVFWKFYDATVRGRYPEKNAFPGDDLEQSSTAATLGLAPAFVPNNGSEEWTGLMEISPLTRSFLDVSPTGGQSQFINLDGVGNPHIADQLQLHAAFAFKRVPMTREEVLRDSESRIVLRVPR